MLAVSWKNLQLGQVVTLQRGFDLPYRLRRSGSIPIVTSSGVTGTHDTARVEGPGVITGRYGTIGEVFFVATDFWPLNTTLYVRDFKGNDPLFVSYLLRTVDFASHSGKSGVPGVNRNDLHKLEVVVPLPDEQRAIASALSDVDGLITVLDKVIAKKRDIKLATMQQLLTGKIRLPGFGQVGGPYKQTEIGTIPGEWDVKPLQDDVLLMSGHHVLARDCNLQGKGLPYITGPADFPNGVIRHTKFTERHTTLCRTNDILVTVKGSGAGTLVLSDGEYCISRQLMAIRVSSWNNRYVYYSLLHRSSQIESAATGLIPGLSRSDILRKRLAIPALPEQHAIAGVLSDIDAEITALERRRDKTKAIKQGMTQALLTGRIPLPRLEVST